MSKVPPEEQVRLRREKRDAKILRLRMQLRITEVEKEKVTEEFETLRQATYKDILENAELKKEVKGLKEKIEQMRLEHEEEILRLQGEGTEKEHQLRELVSTLKRELSYYKRDTRTEIKIREMI